ncbi:DUF3024 domain-containing protein [Ornithinimicrobium cryptoxanthini]|uniref:DUF3024 domain-containing protein n=1 Tax=Ornithinimicrobium cryptoxanthini TaxID=2934161 RepID=UPI00351C7908
MQPRVVTHASQASPGGVWSWLSPCYFDPARSTSKRQERRAPWREDLGPEWTSLPIARLRYTATHKTWTPYWRNRNLRFHLYDRVRPSHTLRTSSTRWTAAPPTSSGADQAP